MTEPESRLDGRFAPTPSGPLHFGSLVTAVASYCQARSTQSAWYLRIEDVDTPRVVAGSSDSILRTLEQFGFEWDGDVIYQSQRFPAYEEVLQQLIDQKQVYACQCSRKSLLREQPAFGPLGMIYPANCRHAKLPIPGHALRLNLEAAGEVTMQDAIYGRYSLDLARQVGDVVMKRVDGVYAYHLAVVLDDDWQGIREVVRGADLLAVTPLHLYLYQLLGLPAPAYMHLPLARNADGKKLSKQTGAQPLSPNDAGRQLVSALRFLEQAVPDGLEREHPHNILRLAINQWSPSRIPALDAST